MNPTDTARALVARRVVVPREERTRDAVERFARLLACSGLLGSIVGFLMGIWL